MTDHDPLAPPGIDTTVAHPAPMLNYVLGGTTLIRRRIAGCCRPSRAPR
jgi:hypothetical protein